MLVRRLEKFLDGILALFSKPAFLYCFILILLVNQLSFSREADRDLFARLAVGRLVLDSHAVSLQDPFSFAPKKPVWVDHEWLAGAVFESFQRTFGDAGLVLLKLSFSCLTVLLLLQPLRSKLTGNFALAIFTTALILDSTYLWSSTVRSQIFTYLMLAYLLINFKRGNISPLPVFLLMVLGVNAHGGFIVPLIFLGIFTSYSRSPAAMIAFSLALIATFLTPYPGLSFHQFMLDALTMSRPSITEWQPLQLFSVNAILPLLTGAAVIFGAAQRRNRSDWLGLALIVLGAYAGFRSVRLMAIFYFCVIVFGHEYLEISLSKFASLFGNYRIKIRRATGLVALCLMVWATSRSMTELANGKLMSLTYNEYPTKLTGEMLQSGHKGKLLCDFNLGSYLLWRLYPNFQIAVDGRYEEVYPDSTLALVEDAMRPTSPHHSEALRALSPDFLLIDTRYNGLEGWESHRIALRDSRFVLLDLGQN